MEPMQLNLSEILNLPKEFVPDDVQQQAIDACCDVTRRVVAVTGKAGSGKTSIIKMIERNLTKAGYLVSCSAPTGKAAKRIKESTGITAMTNHRLLGYGMPIDQEIDDIKTGDKKVVKISTGPKFKRSNPLPYDVIICDEYAMVNREIHDNLIAAMKGGAIIRFFGDVNQLKPIEEDKMKQNDESPFQAALRKFNGIELKTNHRQKAGSGIHMNAERVLEGKLPVKVDDFTIQYTDEPVQKLQDLVMSSLEQGIDYSSTDCQIVTCMNKSWIGTAKLNLTIQSMFWKRDYAAMELPRHRWINDGGVIRIQLGSKVVYTANTYELGDGQYAFNGEIGTVVDINHDDGSFDIDFGDRVVTIPPLLIVVRNDGTVMETDPRKNVDLAYVLTTHKMQGSECKHITYVLNQSTLYGQSRRNFYTAITRAQEKCNVIADMKSITKSTRWAG